jgi:hypothetical protein
VVFLCRTCSNNVPHSSSATHVFLTEGMMEESWESSEIGQYQGTKAYSVGSAARACDRYCVVEPPSQVSGDNNLLKGLPTFW